MVPARCSVYGTWSYRYYAAAILFAIVTSIAYVFTNFTTVFVLTQGGPGATTQILPIFIYQYAFEFSQAGLASAAAMMMFAVSLVFVGIQFWLFGRLEKR